MREMTTNIEPLRARPCPRRNRKNEYSCRIAWDQKAWLKMRAADKNLRLSRYLLLAGNGQLEPPKPYAPKPEPLGIVTASAARLFPTVSMTIRPEQWGPLIERAMAVGVPHPVEFCVRVALGEIRTWRGRTMASNGLDRAQKKHTAAERLRDLIEFWIRMTCSQTNDPARWWHGREQSWDEVTRKITMKED